MNKLLISLGSNENPDTNMSLCRSLLSDIFDYIRFSETSVTSPYGENYSKDFLNQLVYAITEEEQDKIYQNLKAIERKIGRLPADKNNGVVKIDIDLIKWNDSIMKEDEWDRDYIALLLPSLEKVIINSVHDQR